MEDQRIEAVMANFATHIGVGTFVSGALATVTLAADVISAESLMAVTLAGVLGSVLPDIDLKDSRASRAFFSGLAFFFAFCALMLHATNLSIAELWIVVPIVFLIIRYGLEAAFHRFSYHRGIWHSITAGLFFWFGTAIVFHTLLGKHPGIAWLAGGFLFVGYVTHLVLDEIFSVDLLDRRLKLSFGSALKLIDRKHVADTLVIACAAILTFVFAPPSSAFVEGVTSQQVWSGIRQRLLPEDDKWFGISRSEAVANQADHEAPLTTGSIKRSTEPPAEAE